MYNFKAFIDSDESSQFSIGSAECLSFEIDEKDESNGVRMHFDMICHRNQKIIQRYIANESNV